MPNESNVSGIVTDSNGKLQYEDAIRDGFTTVELPLPSGSRTPTETLQVRNIPHRIIREIESHFDVSRNYLRTPDAVSEFAHWSGVLKGAQLVDKDAGRELDRLLAEFEKTPQREQKKYFDTLIKPYIAQLAPRARHKEKK